MQSLELRRQHKALLFSGFFVAALVVGISLLQYNHNRIITAERKIDTLNAQLASVYQRQAPTPQIQTPLACPSFIAVRDQGDRDAGRENDIRQAQMVLARHFKIKLDDVATGVYGSVTKGMVSRFQTENDLAATGQLDEVTMNKLIRTCHDEQPNQRTGYDYGLRRRCVRSYDSTVTNYHSDVHDCTYEDSNWTISVQATDIGGKVCLPEGQALPINNGSLSNLWAKTPTGGWSTMLRSDFASTSNPCGSGTVKYVFADDAAHGGGPLPRPNHANVIATIMPVLKPNGGRARVFTTLTGLWDGRAYTIDIVLNSSKDIDMYPDDAYLLQYSSKPAADILTIDGTVLNLAIADNTRTIVDIDWSKILEVLASRGLINTPTHGWDTAATQAIGFGQETFDTGTDGPIAVTYIENIMINNK